MACVARVSAFIDCWVAAAACCADVIAEFAAAVVALVTPGRICPNKARLPARRGQVSPAR
jgi:hypothetical protein